MSLRRGACVRLLLANIVKKKILKPSAPKSWQAATSATDLGSMAGLANGITVFPWPVSKRCELFERPGVSSVISRASTNQHGWRKRTPSTRFAYRAGTSTHRAAVPKDSVLEQKSTRRGLSLCRSQAAAAAPKTCLLIDKSSGTASMMMTPLALAQLAMAAWRLLSAEQRERRGSTSEWSRRPSAAWRRIVVSTRARPRFAECWSHKWTVQPRRRSSPAMLQPSSPQPTITAATKLGWVTRARCIGCIAPASKPARRWSSFSAAADLPLLRVIERSAPVR
mmetsp:Transcript_36576/g.72871  ORF Transcript_36576/g.72871 Transcript_36576/m.72871 type:complete len:280 (-) Transcript_36576:325-1164(-)